MKRRLIRWARIFLGMSPTEVAGYTLIVMILALLTGIMEIRKSTSHTYSKDQLAQWTLMDSIFTGLKLADSLPIRPWSIKPFDPNQIPFDSLVGWGIPRMVANNLIKYRSAGGVFRYRKDLRKIYGINDSLWVHIQPFISLPLSEALTVTRGGGSASTSRVQAKDPAKKIDLNQADSTQLRSIPGIGRVLSSRIIKYRNILGGYHSMDQLDEVYGLKPQVLKRLKQSVVINPAHIYHKISLNSFDYQSIARHPYISYAQARAIVAYREAHGPFEEIEKLKAVHLIDDSTYIKVYPYLDF